MSCPSARLTGASRARGARLVRRRRRLAAAALTVVTLSSCSADGTGTDAPGVAGPQPAGSTVPETPTAPTATSAPDLGAPQVVATGMDAPWGLAFLPDGTALVGERDTGRVLRLSPDGGEPATAYRLSEVAPGGEGGLLGLAASPRYAQDGLVYAYLTAE